MPLEMPLPVNAHTSSQHSIGQAAGDARLPLLGNAVVGEGRIQQMRRERRVTASHDLAAKRLGDLDVSGYVARERAADKDAFHRFSQRVS